MDGTLLSRYNPASSFLFFLFSSLFLLLTAFPLVKSGDAEALLALRASVDPLGLLHWGGGSDFCQWEGVKECLNGRVMKLVVERFNLSGKIDGKSLNQLDQLRVLSFKENSLSGQIPELSGLANLKSLFLNNNMFSGRIPVSLSQMHRLKVIVLAGNRLSGPIPQSLVGLSRLYVVYVQDNQLSGSVPPFNQSSLRFFNVSNNALSGGIPATASLVRFNESSFLANIDLCGEQVRRPCNLAPSSSPSYPVLPPNMGHRKQNKKLILVIVLSVGGFVLLCIVTILLMMCLRKMSKENEAKVVARGVDEGRAGRVASGSRDDDNAAGKQGGFSWDQGVKD